MSDLLKQIVARLKNERATDVSDEELHRCLFPCVGKAKLVNAACAMRDRGELTSAMVNPAP
jgi:hypothetical protein